MVNGKLVKYIKKKKTKSNGVKNIPKYIWNPVEGSENKKTQVIKSSEFGFEWVRSYRLGFPN